MRFGMVGGVHIEIAVSKGEQGAQFSQEFFRDLEVRVGAGRTYRGRVISLESQHDYLGRGGAVKVHQLRAVKREDVILPPKTLKLLDRNVGGFVAARERIKALHFTSKKGLLFYGPPGTGKAHTIHYLASQLPQHTPSCVLQSNLRLLYGNHREISGLRNFGRCTAPAALSVNLLKIKVRQYTRQLKKKTLLRSDSTLNPRSLGGVLI
jgi:hypothetical protein